MKRLFTFVKIFINNNGVYYTYGTGVIKTQLILDLVTRENQCERLRLNFF